MAGQPDPYLLVVVLRERVDEFRRKARPTCRNPAEHRFLGHRAGGEPVGRRPDGRLGIRLGKRLGDRAGAVRTVPDDPADHVVLGPGAGEGVEARADPHTLVRILPQLRHQVRSHVGPGGDQRANLRLGVAGEPGDSVGRGVPVPGQGVHHAVREALLDERGGQGTRAEHESVARTEGRQPGLHPFRVQLPVPVPRRFTDRGVRIVEQPRPLRRGERLPPPSGPYPEFGGLVAGHGAVEGQRDLPGRFELPDDLVLGDLAVLAPVPGGQEGHEDVVRQRSDPSGVVTGAGGEPPADDPRRVRRQGGESRRVDVPVAGERATDDVVRMAQGRVDDGVRQVTTLAHQQAGFTGRSIQQAYQYVGGRRRIEGDTAQPRFTQRVEHRVILSPRLLKASPRSAKTPLLAFGFDQLLHELLRVHRVLGVIEGVVVLRAQR